LKDLPRNRGRLFALDHRTQLTREGAQWRTRSLGIRPRRRIRRGQQSLPRSCRRVGTFALLRPCALDSLCRSDAFVWARMAANTIGAGVRLPRWNPTWRGRSTSAVVFSADAATSCMPSLQSPAVANAFGNPLGLHSGTESLANTTLCSSAQAFRSGTCRNTLRQRCPPPKPHRSSMWTPIRNHRQK